MASPTVEAGSELQVALRLACERLLALQDETGWWQGELQTNVTMDAEDMLLREFLGVRRPEETERSAAWIRSQQRADGTWANFHGGPGELSTTIEAYWALRLAGDPPETEHMAAAASFIRSQGGIQRARVFTHVWLALFGLWSWDGVPALPPEVVLLPPFVPLNVYDFACWARQTIVALSLVKAFRPVHPLPFALDELRAAGRKPAPGSLPVAGVGHGAVDDRAQRRGHRARASRDVAGGVVAARRGGRRAWRLGRRPPAPEAWWVGIRVRKRQLPRRRRHGGGRDGAAARAHVRRRRAQRCRGGTRAAMARGHAERRRGVGGLRRRQHPRARARAAVPGLRRGDRRAERRCHRSRRGDALRAGRRRRA